ncbi:hypothetical protein [Maribacter sp. 1_MG-2023]|uniref:hypothetical protein n=1 Tax=Maribacter sp. 1_MG-2023 TaxID=3062677 RepID=UPI0026E398D9|nr:hypothetical protein [Maribacter sp. 1_MG-2023]MDO6471614.1 hypothetical protein [Maribacter sp. 1_MG-2023]
MKGILIVLLILIQGQVESDSILKKELIGTWKIEKVQVTRPGVCIQNDFSQMIGTTFKFTESQQLLITSKSNWFQFKYKEEILWYLEDDYLIIKSKNHQEYYRSKITFKKSKLNLHLGNLIAIHLIKK